MLRHTRYKTHIFAHFASPIKTLSHLLLSNLCIATAQLRSDGANLGRCCSENLHFVPIFAF